MNLITARDKYSIGDDRFYSCNCYRYKKINSISIYLTAHVYYSNASFYLQILMKSCISLKIEVAFKNLVKTVKELLRFI